MSSSVICVLSKLFPTVNPKCFKRFIPKRKLTTDEIHNIIVNLKSATIDYGNGKVRKLYVWDMVKNTIKSVGSAAYITLYSKTLHLTDLLETDVRELAPEFENPKPETMILVTHDRKKILEYGTNRIACRTRHGTYYRYANDMDEYIPENEDLYDDLMVVLKRLCA